MVGEQDHATHETLELAERESSFDSTLRPHGFFVGLLSFGFRLEKTAYRYASVTLTIIVLIPRANPAWTVSVHRFIEVSVGIVVALIVVALWPERSPIPVKNAAE